MSGTTRDRAPAGEDRCRIRKAESRDADRVFALLADFATSYRPRREAFDRHYLLLIASSDSALVVADLEGRVVGYALAFRLLTLYANGALVELQELMVEEGSRGSGVGQRLVEAVEEWARSVRAVEMTVPTRRAGGYYARLGFTETASYYKKKLSGSPGG